MGPKFQFLKKVFLTIFFTYKTCFTTFHVDWSQKMDKNFFEPIFQNFLQVIVPLWDQNFNFWKAVSDNFFHLQNMFHNISRWLKPKNRQKFFRTNFSKFFTSYCPPMGPKFQFLKSCFRQFYSLTKHVSQHFTLIEAKKWTKIFSNQFFKIFYKLLSPYGTKISISKKVFPTIFFTYKTCFTTFHVDWSQKMDKNFFEPIFQNFLQVENWCPFSYGTKISISKKVFPTILSLTKHVSQHFTLIEAKKRTKIFSNQFFKIFYKLLSPYGTKISIFEKSVSDNFFHLQNMFHISRWLK